MARDWIRFCAVLFSIFIGGHAATLNGKGGNWSNPNSWVEGRIPADQDSVIIGTGVTITLDTQTSDLVLLSIQDGGSLIFSNGKGESDTELAITVETFFVAGLLQMGTDKEPLARPARIVLMNYEVPVVRGLDGTPYSILDEPYGKKVLLVYDHGKWLAHGKGRNPTWTRLSASTSRGDVTLQLVDKVDWKVNDQVVITSTDFNPDQTERHYVKAISADGKSVTLQQPLKFGHFGEVLDYQGFPVDMRAEVGVLTSNVRIFGDFAGSANYSSIQEPAYAGFDEFMQFGGHTAFIHNATIKLEGLEFFHMGQGGRMGRYPIHWHIMYEAPGQYLKRTSMHDMYMRCVSIHTTNNVTIEEVICLDTYGHSIYQEDAQEFGNSFIRNLIIGTRRITNGQGSMDMATGSYKYAECSANPPGLRLQHMDYEPSGFWITNTNATLIGNVVVGHPFGYWIRVEPMFAEPDFPNIGCTVCPPGCRFPGKAGPTHGFNKMIFEGNVAHSNEVGWWVKENWVPHDYFDLQIINHFTVYKNSVGVMNYGVNNMKFTNIISADNTVGMSTDWVRGGRIILQDSIFIKETTNYGNTYDNTTYSTVIPANCSAIYPGQARTWTRGRSEHSGNVLGVQLGDNQFAMENVYFVNFKPNCLEAANRLPTQYCGAWEFPIKRNGLLPVTTRYMDKIWFVNSTFHNSYHPNSSCYYWNGKPDATRPGAWSYLSGHLDVNGSLPCSPPGSYWMWPNKNFLADNCVYQPQHDMSICPPIKGSYETFYFGGNRVWSFDPNWSASAINVEWECGKNFSFDGSQINLRSDKNYTLNVVTLPTTRGLNIRSGNPAFKGMWLTLQVPGSYSAGLYYFCSWPPKFGFQPRPEFVKSQCHCNTTYVQVWVPAPVNATDPGGNCEVQLFFDSNENTTCDNQCGNPWPIPAPTGYACGENRVAPANQVCPTKVAPRYTGLDYLKPNTTTEGEIGMSIATPLASLSMIVLAALALLF